MYRFRCRWALAAGSVIMLAVTLPVYAAKLTIKGTASQTLTLSDNYFLNPRPSGFTGQSSTDLSINALLLTPRTRYSLDGNLSYFTYFGPGASDTTLKTGLPLGARFAVDHSIDPLTKANALITWRRADLATQLLQETGRAVGRGFSDTYSAQTGWSRQLSAVDLLTVSAVASTVNFTESTQSPYRDMSSTVSWRRSFGSTFSSTQSVNVDYYAAEDATDSRRLLWKVTSDFQWNLSRRLSLNGMAGLVFSNPWNGAPLVVSSPTTGVFGPGAGHGPIWSLGANYLLSPTLTGSASISQVVAPTILGDLQKTTSVQGSLSQQINRASTIAFGSQYGIVDSGSGSSSTVWSASVSYSHTLTREVRASASYTFTQRDDVAGTVRANIFRFTVARDLSILP